MLKAEEILSLGMEKLELKDDDKIIHKLLIYKDILKKWNKKINLTALRHDEDIIKNHLLDSLSVTKLIDQKKILDVGSGAGFPGIVLAICDKTRHVTLVDKVRKKTVFMNQVCLELNLNNVSVIHSRVEDIETINKYDAIIARAFGEMSLLMKLTKNLLVYDGIWYGMKSKKVLEENIVKNKNFLKIYDIKVPFLGADRYFIKIKNT